VGEMHTRLKEPDRRGNAGRLHRDYRIRSASAQYHVGSLSGGLQQYEQVVAPYCRQVTAYRKRVAEYENRPDNGASTISDRSVGAWVAAGSRASDRLRRSTDGVNSPRGNSETKRRGGLITPLARVTRAVRE